MRVIAIAEKVEFEFNGNVARDAITIGDVDNDGHNEIVVGNDLGEVAIFKGRERVQTISDLTFVVCVAVGDLRNIDKNTLVIVTADGWCHLYETLSDSPEVTLADEITVNEIVETPDEVDGQGPSTSNPQTTTETQSSSESAAGEKKLSASEELKNPLVCVHSQRIPANSKCLILGDVDGDGLIEMVIGLTDRVVRTYRFVNNPEILNAQEANSQTPLGTLVALNKWECANQIGSISLHHSYTGEPSILVAQPGGTFMRIKCSVPVGIEPENMADDEVERLSDFMSGTVDYQSLGISRMRNPEISTEIIGDLREKKSEPKPIETGTSGQVQTSNEAGVGKPSCKSPPYAVSTLDGTIMLVQDEVILWAMAVDHQIFALTKLDITGDGADEIVICTWDGHTYILDQQKTIVKIHLETSVRAFHSGIYTLDADNVCVTALVYVTFNNTILVYYDIPLKELVVKKFVPDLKVLSRMFINENRTPDQALEHVQNMSQREIRDLVEYVLYEM